MHVLSPIASKIEAVTEKWMVELLGLPEETVAGYVSGSSTATITGLTTGRNYLLDKTGYNIFKNRLFDAPLNFKHFLEYYFDLQVLGMILTSVS